MFFSTVPGLNFDMCMISARIKTIYLVPQNHSDLPSVIEMHCFLCSSNESVFTSLKIEREHLSKCKQTADGVYSKICKSVQITHTVE